MSSHQRHRAGILNAMEKDQKRERGQGKGDKGKGIKLRQLPAHQTSVCVTSLLHDFYYTVHLC